MKRLRTIFVAVLMIASFAFIVWRTFSQWQRVDWSILRFSLVPLLLSFAVYLLLWELVRGVKLQMLYRVLGHRLKWWDATLLNSVARVAKYIPGGIWVATMRAFAAERFGIPKRATFTAAILDVMFLFLTAWPLIAWAVMGTSPLWIALIVATVAGGPFLVWLGLLLAHRILKDKMLAVKPVYRDLLYLSVLYLITWGIQAVATYFLVRSFYPIDIAGGYQVARAWMVSWLASFVVPIIPGGLGMRDALFLTTLGPIFPVAIGGVVTIVSRVWLMVCEAVSSSIAWVLLRGRSTA